MIVSEDQNLAFPADSVSGNESLSGMPVPVVDSLLREEFRNDYLRQNRPVLVAQQWQRCPAVNTWTTDYLIEHCGQREIEVEFYPDGKRENAFAYQAMKLADYLTLVRHDEAARRHYYLAEMSLVKSMPEIAQEVTLPAFMDTAETNYCRQVVFAGFDTLTTGHYHRGRTQAVLGQIAGQKKVVLFPPSEFHRLDMQPWYSLRPNHSKIPFHAGDYRSLASQWPKLADVKSYECTVGPGQLLFIPDHWVHYVYGQNESISVTWFWDGDSETGYRPGISRDYYSSLIKASMVTAAGLSHRLGWNRSMVRAAACLNIISRDEQATVLAYLNKMGARRPAELQTKAIGEKAK